MANSNGYNYKYLDFQELGGHHKHTKPRGNQKTEDPNDTHINTIQLFCIHTLLCTNFSITVSTASFPYFDIIRLYGIEVQMYC